MENATLKNERLLWVDVAKGIGMILVVIGHSEPPELINNFIFSFHMPLFFFLSGFVYRLKSTNIPMKKRIFKDIKSLILPYIITVCLIGIFLLIIQAQGKKGFYDSLFDFGKSALFGSGSGYNRIKPIGEIWFLLAMFWARRFMNGLFSIKNTILRFAILAIGLEVGIVLASLRIWVPTNIDIALIGAFFMYCGFFIQNKKHLLNKLYFLCAMPLVYLSALTFSHFEMANRHYYRLWFLSLSGAIAMSILISKFSMIVSKIKGISSFFSYIGKHSLLFLCIHSLDWRLPFPRTGQSLITPFRFKSWYWLLVSLHRFSFDYFLMLIILGIVALFQYLRNFKRNPNINTNDVMK